MNYQQFGEYPLNYNLCINIYTLKKKGLLHFIYILKTCLIDRIEQKRQFYHTS